MDKKTMMVSGLITVMVFALVGVGVMRYKNNTEPQGNANPAVTLNGGSPQSQGNISGQPDAKNGQQPKTESGQKSAGNGGQANASKGGPAGGPMASISSILGITEEELQTKLKAGTTLETIASGKGMTLEQLKEKLIAKEKTSLDNQVAQGKITSAQAQEMLSRTQSMDLSKLGTEPPMGGAAPPGGTQQPPSGTKP